MTGTSEPPRTGAQELSRVLVRGRSVLLLVWPVTLVIGAVVAARVPATRSSYVSLQFERPRPSPGAPRGSAESPGSKSQAEVMRQLADNDVFLRSVVARSGILRDAETREWAVRSAARHRSLPLEQRIEAFLIDHLRASVAIHPEPGSVFRIKVSDPRP